MKVLGTVTILVLYISLVICCREGFVPLHGKCYHFSNISATWQESVSNCEEMDAKLLSIEDAQESFVINIHLLYQRRDVSYWTSGSDQEIEGQFQWTSSNKKVGFSYWCQGQPDDAGKREDCIHIFHSNDLTCWNDLTCTRKEAWGLPVFYICEY